MALPVDAKAMDSMGMNSMVYNAILESEYYKELGAYDQFDEIVDEIYNKVDNLDPTVSRGDNAASSAWCCMYKLYSFKLTNHQMKRLLTHTDSPYIRGIGLLYLRLCLPPKFLWDWYEPYLDDEERLNLVYSKNQEGTHTIGQLVRILLLEAKFLSTMLPRIPVPVEKAIKSKLQEYTLKNPPKESADQEERKRDNSKSGGTPPRDRSDRRDDRYEDRSRDRYDDRSRDRYDDRSRGRNDGRDRYRYDERSRHRDDGRRDDRYRDDRRHDDRYRDDRRDSSRRDDDSRRDRRRY